MSWKKDEFKKMKVDVYNFDFERNIIKHNEWLQKVFHPFLDDEELNSLKGVTMNLMVRCICLCYDPNSPLVYRFPDIKHRKIEAFTMLQTKVYKEGRFSEDVDNIIIGKNPKFNRLVLQFLKAIDSLAYTGMVYYTESYYELLAQLQGQDGKDLADILIKIDKIETQLKKKTKEFFVNDENLINYFSSNKIYEDYEAQTPETMARKLTKIKDTVED